MEIYPEDEFERQRRHNSFKNYEIFVDDKNKKILNTDIEKAIMRYTADLQDETLFDAQFVACFVNLLGYKLCFSLSGNDAKSAELLQVYEYMLKNAKTKSLNQKRDKIDYISEIIRARG